MLFERIQIPCTETVLSFVLPFFAGLIGEYGKESAKQVTKLVHFNVLLWNQAGFWHQSCEGMKQFYQKCKKLMFFVSFLISLT